MNSKILVVIVMIVSIVSGLYIGINQVSNTKESEIDSKDVLSSDVNLTSGENTTQQTTSR